jgi:hypothetical protein
MTILFFVAPVESGLCLADEVGGGSFGKHHLKTDASVWLRLVGCRLYYESSIESFRARP